MKRKAAIFCLVAAILVSQSQTSLASKIEDAENAKSKATQNLDSVNDKIDDLESEKNAIQEEINDIDKELGEIIISVSVLEEKLGVKEDQLAAVQEQLAVAREDEAQQYESMKKRIKFMYERGDTAFIASILEAESVSELLNQVEYYNEVYDYDRELLVEYQKVKLEVEELETKVEKEIAELEKTRVDYQNQKQKLEALKAEKKAEGQNMAAQITDATKLAAEYMDVIHAQDKIIADEKKRIAEEEEAARQAEEARRAAEAQRQAEQQAASSGSNTSPAAQADSAANSGGNANPAPTTGVSGSNVVSYAMQFVGNRYVWGGNDPNTGADCSGYIKYVYAHFGISLPRTSYTLRSVGQEVSYANAQPGDIICYEGHVAIYMGGGQIVHAKGSAYGIVSGDNAAYKSIVTVRRVL